MRQLTLRLAAASFTFIVGVMTTFGWYVPRRINPFDLPESDAERATKRAPIEGLTGIVTFDEMAHHPEIYRDRIVRVTARYPYGDEPLVFFDFPRDNEPLNFVSIGYESDKVRSEIEQRIKAIDESMNHCWYGIGPVVGRLESLAERNSNYGD